MSNEPKPRKSFEKMISKIKKTVVKSGHFVITHKNSDGGDPDRDGPHGRGREHERGVEVMRLGGRDITESAGRSIPQVGSSIYPLFANVAERPQGSRVIRPAGADRGE